MSLAFWNTYHKYFYPGFYAWIAYVCLTYGCQKSFLTFSLISAFSLLKTIVGKKVKGSENYKAVIIGAGWSGLSAAKYMKDLGIDYVILEKAEELGGVWWFNRYPGIVCDVASHLYSFSFCLNPHWSRLFGSKAEIMQYMKEAADYFGMTEKIKFGCEVTNAKWHENAQKWIVTTKRGQTFEGNFLFQGTGALQHPLIPDFKGKDSFKGSSFHTSEWPINFNIKGKKVGVIGTGASGVQVVPNVAGDVESLLVFQRTPCWAPPRLDRKHWTVTKVLFGVFPPAMVAYRWFLFLFNERIYWENIYDKSWIFKGPETTKLLTEYTKSIVQDPTTAVKLTPKFQFGSRRIVPADEYLQTFNRDNVHLITDTIDRITADGIKTLDGVEHELDVIVYATGFSIYKSMISFKIEGLGGKLLDDVFDGKPKGYNGAMMSGFPNMFFLYGPNTNLGHNSIIFMVECQLDFAKRAIRRLIKHEKSSVEVKESKLNEYVAMVQEYAKSCMHSKGTFDSWYNNSFKDRYNGINWSRDCISFWWICTNFKQHHFIWK